MNDFISVANLPIRGVEKCVVSGQYKSVIGDLNKMGIKTILVPFCNKLQKGVSCHADMIGCYLGNGKMLVYNYDDAFNQQLQEEGLTLIFTQEPLQEKYPFDIACNAAQVGKFIICNRKHTDSSILCGIEEENIINVSQGYAKCAVLVVDEKSIITADTGIAKQAKAKGIDVLLIAQGHIQLDGYSYGLIGGCATKLDDKAIYFTGSITKHPSASDIQMFLQKRKIKIIYGSANQPIDVGSILPLR